MNKIKLILMGAAALLAASCTNELENEIDNQEVGRPVVLRATIEGAGTRAAVNSGKVTWQKDDAISVRLDNNNNLTMTAAEECDGKAEATFSGNIFGSGHLVTPTVAVYPAGEHNLKDGELSVNMPATYTVADNANTNMPMICEFAENGTGSFKHLGGVMQFKVGLEYILAKDLEPKQFRFTTLDNKNISGNFAVETEGENKVIKATSGDGSASSVTIAFNADQIATIVEGTYTVKELTVNVPLPVGSYTGIKLEILDAAGNSLVKPIVSATATNNITRAKLIEMPRATPVDITAGTPEPELPKNAIAVVNEARTFNADND